MNVCKRAREKSASGLALGMIFFEKAIASGWATGRVISSSIYQDSFFFSQVILLHLLVCLTSDNHVTTFFKVFVQLLSQPPSPPMPPHQHPMAPKAQYTTPAAHHAEGHCRLNQWMMCLYAALNNENTYEKAHLSLFREFEVLSDLVCRSEKPSIIPYIEAIFNHTMSQGYQQDVHYQPLLQAMAAYCNKAPPPIWVAPPDKYSWSLTPGLPPLPKSPTLIPSKVPAKPI